MHCHLLLRVMRHHGLGALLDSQIDGLHIRKLLWETVLATDMSVHADFMDRFQRIMTTDAVGPICLRQMVLCQAIMKCADISNPVRQGYFAGVCPMYLLILGISSLEPTLSGLPTLGYRLDGGVDIAGTFREVPRSPCKCDTVHRPT